jgi:hypothetical protein
MREKKVIKGYKFDRQLLIKRVAMMRIKGKSTRFLLDFLQEEIGMGQTTSYEVLRDVQDYIMEIQEKEIDKAYADAIARLEEEYESTSDRKLRLHIQQELNKLQGLYKSQKIDITSNGKDLTPTEIIIKIVDKNNEEV